MIGFRGLALRFGFVIVLGLAGAVSVDGAQAGIAGSRNGVAPALIKSHTLLDGAWIAVEASRLSGREVVVSCAPTLSDWSQALNNVGLPGVAADTYYGFSEITRSQIRLSPYVCEGLRLGALASTRKANELQVAWAVDVLLHESVHMARFTRDEALTEACARAELPRELHRLYGIAYDSPELRRLTYDATLFRRTQEAGYQGGTCPVSGA